MLWYPLEPKSVFQNRPQGHPWIPGYSQISQTPHSLYPRPIHGTDIRYHCLPTTGSCFILRLNSPDNGGRLAPYIRINLGDISMAWTYSNSGFSVICILCICQIIQYNVNLKFSQASYYIPEVFSGFPSPDTVNPLNPDIYLRELSIAWIQSRYQIKFFPFLYHISHKPKAFHEFRVIKTFIKITVAAWGRAGTPNILRISCILGVYNACYFLALVLITNDQTVSFTIGPTQNCSGYGQKPKLLLNFTLKTI